MQVSCLHAIQYILFLFRIALKFKIGRKFCPSTWIPSYSGFFCVQYSRLLFFAVSKSEIAAIVLEYVLIAHLLPSVSRRPLHLYMVLYDYSMWHAGAAQNTSTLYAYEFHFDFDCYYRCVYLLSIPFIWGIMEHFLCCSWYRSMRCHFCKIIYIPLEFNFVILFVFICCCDDAIGNACNKLHSFVKPSAWMKVSAFALV